MTPGESVSECVAIVVEAEGVCPHGRHLVLRVMGAVDAGAIGRERAPIAQGIQRPALAAAGAGHGIRDAIRVGIRERTPLEVDQAVELIVAGRGPVGLVKLAVGGG